MASTNLTSIPIANFLQGVSQQPDRLRTPEQNSAQFNTLADSAVGLVRRNPFIHVAELADIVNSNIAIHTIKRDDNEQYLMVVQDGTMLIYKPDGTKIHENTNAYFDTTDPFNTIKFLTMGDTTIVLNTTVVVANEAATPVATTHQKRAHIWVKQGVIGKEYTVSYNDGGADVVAATYTCPTASTAGDLPNLRTNTIRNSILGQLGTNLPAAFLPINTNIVGDNIISIEVPDGYELKVSDGYNNAACVLVHERVDTVADLPPEAYQGSVYKVSSTDEDGYYVQYTRDRGWSEYTAPLDESINFDQFTMPLQVVNTAVDIFVYSYIPWEDRKVGSQESNPHPSISGKRIRDIFFSRDRLGLLTEDTVVCSRAGDYFNLFPNSARTVFDDDPIDVQASGQDVTSFEHALPSLDSVWITGGKYLYRFNSGDDILTPETVQLTIAGQHASNSACKPVLFGSELLLGEATGEYSQVKSLRLTENGRNILETELLTAHVPKYIRGTVNQIQSFGTLGMCFVTANEYPREIFVYQTQSNQEGRVQSAWHEWATGSPILYDKIIAIGSFSEETCYFIVEREGKRMLEIMDLTPQPNADNLANDDDLFPVYLDNRQLVESSDLVYVGAIENSVYAGYSNFTDLTGPHTIIPTLATSSITDAVLVPYQAKDHIEGYGWAHETVSDDTYWNGAINSATHVAISGDWTGKNFYVGYDYASEIKLSKQYIRDKNGKSIVTKELYWNALHIQTNNSGRIDTEVTPKYRDSRYYPLTARKTGAVTPSSTNPHIISDIRRLPIRAKGHEVEVKLKSYRWYPMGLVQGEMVGRVNGHT